MLPNSNVSAELQAKLNKRLQQISANQSPANQESGAQHSSSGLVQIVDSSSSDRKPHVTRFNIADTPPATPKAVARRAADGQEKHDRALDGALVSPDEEQPIENRETDSLPAPPDTGSPPTAGDAGCMLGSTLSEDDEEASQSDDEEPLEYFMLTFASSLERPQAAALLDKVRSYEQRNSSVQRNLKNRLAATLKTRYATQSTSHAECSAQCALLESHHSETLKLDSAMRKLDENAERSVHWDYADEPSPETAHPRRLPSPRGDSRSMSKLDFCSPFWICVCFVAFATGLQVGRTSTSHSMDLEAMDLNSITVLSCEPDCRACIRVSPHKAANNESRFCDGPRAESAKIFLELHSNLYPLKRKHGELANTVESLEADRSHFFVESIELEKHHTILISDRNELEVQMCRLEAVTAKLTADLELQRQQCVQHESDEVEEGRAQLLSDCKALRARVKDQEANVSKLKAYCEVKRQQLVRDAYDDYKEQHIQLVADRQDLQVQVRHLQGAVASLTADMEAQRQLGKNASEECDCEGFLAQVQIFESATAKLIADFDNERWQLAKHASDELEEQRKQSLSDRDLLQVKVKALESNAIQLTASFEVEQKRLANNAFMQRRKLLWDRAALQVQVKESRAAVARLTTDFDAERQTMAENISAEVAVQRTRLVLAREELQAQVKDLKAETAKMRADFSVERQELMKHAFRKLMRHRTQFKDLKANAAELTADFEIERQQLGKHASTQLEEQHASLLLDGQGLLAQVTSGFEVERQQLTNNIYDECEERRTQIILDRSVLQTQVKDLEAASAQLTASFDAETRQLAESASTECEARRKQLVLEHDVLQAQVEKLEYAATACSAQVQQLEDDESKRKAALETPHVEFRTDVAIEESAMHVRQQHKAEVQTDVQSQASEDKEAVKIKNSRTSDTSLLRSPFNTDTKQSVDTYNDLHQVCSIWAHAGRCKSSPEIMHVVCRESCRSESYNSALGARWTLDPTRPSRCCCDSNDFCLDWANEGLCESNREFMLPKCPYSCNACGSTRTTLDAA